MNVDDILANPIEAAALPADAIPIHTIIIIEYAEPGSDQHPTAHRLATVTDDNLPPWTSISMLRFAAQLELDDVHTDDEDAEQ